MVHVKSQRSPWQRYCALVAIILTSYGAWGQQGESSEDLKKMTLEELMNIEITSVSRRPEKLGEAASALQVITSDAIRRSGATSIPEALRLAPNLQVGQVNSSQWIISARGFNAPFSNKLLVMIDGRTVYSPLFAGVFWDVQNVLLEDIDRIEVISGPGSTAWGANAVNGVINIITKDASETQGFYASAGLGTYLRRRFEARYGGKIGDDLSYRIYAMSIRRDHTFAEEQASNDDWYIGQSGFSVEWQPSPADALTVHGNVYMGTHNNIPSASSVDGQNILGRWSHDFNERSQLVVQGYFDRTWRRDIPSTLSDEVETMDVDINHNFAHGRHHNFVWGVGYRHIRNSTYNRTLFVGIIPNTRDMPLYSAFIQDEISLFNSPLKLIVGTKLQHNIFSGLELQPSGRLAWVENGRVLWGAVSRAIRAPSRIDVDYRLPVEPLPPELPSVAGGPNFDSEKVVAWEMGYRLQARQRFSANVSVFYNKYDDLYSVDSLAGTYTYQIQNGTRGTSHGIEVSGYGQIGERWRLRGGYTYFDKDLSNKPGHIYDFANLGLDARNRFFLHSALDLPANFQFDFTFRYIDPIPQLGTPDYMTFDARLAWVKNWLEVAVIGQNLWEDRHRELIARVPRNIYVSATCRF